MSRVITPFSHVQDRLSGATELLWKKDRLGDPPKAGDLFGVFGTKCVKESTLERLEVPIVFGLAALFH